MYTDYWCNCFQFSNYGDFSGYSDIALGTAKLFGFELLSNFKFPYFSRNIAEFWRRWHISLSSWFKDYLYIPLGGSKEGKTKAIRNTFIIPVVHLGDIDFKAVNISV
ncbi:MAG TPA: MBOAT family O-acyltransferase [Segetibacter sp.]